MARGTSTTPNATSFCEPRTHTRHPTSPALKAQGCKSQLRDDLPVGISRIWTTSLFQGHKVLKYQVSEVSGQDRMLGVDWNQLDSYSLTLRKELHRNIAQSSISTAQRRPGADAWSSGLSFAFAGFPFWTHEAGLRLETLFGDHAAQRDQIPHYSSIMKSGPKLHARHGINLLSLAY